MFIHIHIYVYICVYMNYWQHTHTNVYITHVALHAGVPRTPSSVGAPSDPIPEVQEELRKIRKLPRSEIQTMGPYLVWAPNLDFLYTHGISSKNKGPYFKPLLKQGRRGYGLKLRRAPSGAQSLRPKYAKQLFFGSFWKMVPFTVPTSGVQDVALQNIW